VQKYLLRRGLFALSTVIGVSLIVFVVLRILPGDPLVALLGVEGHSKMTPADRAVIMKDLGFSDSLPVHLVSREAIRLYRAKLAEGGVLAFNLSNRYLDLDPVMGRQAEDTGLVCRIGSDTTLSAAEREAGKQPSIWAVMTASEKDLGSLASDPRWRRPRTSRWRLMNSVSLSSAPWMRRIAACRAAWTCQVSDVGKRRDRWSSGRNA